MWHEKTVAAFGKLGQFTWTTDWNKFSVFIHTDLFLANLSSGILIYSHINCDFCRWLTPWPIYKLQGTLTDCKDGPFDEKTTGPTVLSHILVWFHVPALWTSLLDWCHQDYGPSFYELPAIWEFRVSNIWCISPLKLLHCILATLLLIGNKVVITFCFKFTFLKLKYKPKPLEIASFPKI